MSKGDEGGRQRSRSPPRKQRSPSPRGGDRDAPRGGDRDAPRGGDRDAPRGGDRDAPRGGDRGRDGGSGGGGGGGGGGCKLYVGSLSFDTRKETLEQSFSKCACCTLSPPLPRVAVSHAPCNCTTCNFLQFLSFMFFKGTAG